MGAATARQTVSQTLFGGREGGGVWPGVPRPGAARTRLARGENCKNRANESPRCDGRGRGQGAMARPRRSGTQPGALRQTAADGGDARLNREKRAARPAGQPHCEAATRSLQNVDWRCALQHVARGVGAATSPSARALRPPASAQRPHRQQQQHGPPHAVTARALGALLARYCIPAARRLAAVSAARLQMHRGSARRQRASHCPAALGCSLSLVRIAAASLVDSGVRASAETPAKSSEEKGPMLKRTLKR